MSIIVLDPGHSDYTHEFPGGYREGVLVRKTGLKAKELLEKQGHKVILTRTKASENPSLNARGCLAVNNKAKIFVSIHTNAIGEKDQTISSGVYGIFYARKPEDTWAADKKINAPNGRKLAQLISQEVAKALSLPLYSGSNNGAKVWWKCPANLGVLVACSNWSKTEAACLIEAGWGDNPNDRKILSKEDAPEKYALGICRGIYRYAGWEIPEAWIDKTTQLSPKFTVKNFSNLPQKPSITGVPIDELDEAINWMINNKISDGSNIKNNPNLERVAIWLKRFDSLIERGE